MTFAKVNWYGDKLIAVIREATPDALFEGGKLLVERAKENIHSQSGDLAKSGFVKSANKSTYVKTDVSLPQPPVSDEMVVAGFSAFYAKMVELGHPLRRGGKTYGSVAARPFLRPAIDHYKNDIGEVVAIVYRKRIG